MFRYNLLIKSDIDLINAEANFTDDQQQIFDLLTDKGYQSRFNDTNICLRLSVSPSAFYKIKKEIETKIKRILPQKDC